jgi:hypothetical protein
LEVFFAFSEVFDNVIYEYIQRPMLSCSKLNSEKKFVLVESCDQALEPKIERDRQYIHGSVMRLVKI